jgi:hypothetical protein
MSLVEIVQRKENTKIRSLMSKKGTMTKRKRTKDKATNDLQNTTQKIKDWVTQTPQTYGG